MRHVRLFETEGNPGDLPAGDREYGVSREAIEARFVPVFQEREAAGRGSPTGRDTRSRRLAAAALGASYSGPGTTRRSTGWSRRRKTGHSRRSTATGGRGGSGGRVRGFARRSVRVFGWPRGSCVQARGLLLVTAVSRAPCMLLSKSMTSPFHQVRRAAVTNFPKVASSASGRGKLFTPAAMSGPTAPRLPSPPRTAPAVSPSSSSRREDREWLAASALAELLEGFPAAYQIRPKTGGSSGAHQVTNPNTGFVFLLQTASWSFPDADCRSQGHRRSRK